MYSLYACILHFGLDYNINYKAISSILVSSDTSVKTNIPFCPGLPQCRSGYVSGLATRVCSGPMLARMYVCILAFTRSDWNGACKLYKQTQMGKRVIFTHFDIFRACIRAFVWLLALVTMLPTMHLFCQQHDVGRSSLCVAAMSAVEGTRSQIIGA